MRTPHLLAFAAWLAFAAHAGTAPAPFARTHRPAANRHSLIGTWKVIEAHPNGKYVARDVSEGQIWVFTGDQLTIDYQKAGYDESEAFFYHLDVTQTPRHVDLTRNRDQGRELVMRGIYKISGDRMKLCRSRGNRPTTLDDNDFLQRGQITYVLQRVR